MKFEYSLMEMYALLQEVQELDRIEAKAGSQIGSSVMQTICAFANTQNLRGGYLLLGVSEPDDQHDNFWVSGIENSDQLLNDLQANCRDQFEQPISIYVKKEKIDGKQVVGIYVPELSDIEKPCTFKGKFDSKNKRKTGVWLRGANCDYEATQKDLEPLILAKTGSSFEQVRLPDAEWEDLDQGAIARYRKLRSDIRPDAPELLADDKEMLFAMRLVDRKKDYMPNVAGLLLFGKSLSLRRLLPSMRIDYVRVLGNEYDQEKFLETLDLREALIYSIPKLESKILSDMPRHFRLEDDQLQRSDMPLLPQQVVRETVVNAVMHRDYYANQPTLIVRYDDRLEVKNAGYSLKPTEELGKLGSILRNPNLAAVLYDINYAETKGSGIGKIRHRLKNAGLSDPYFKSDLRSNYFVASYSFHQLLNEEQLMWLAYLKEYQLNQDEVMALVIAKESRQVSNATLREVSNIDTIQANKTLRHLVSKGLLQKFGSSRATYYELTDTAKSYFPRSLSVEQNGLSVEQNDLSVEQNGLSVELQRKINSLGKRAKTEDLLDVLVSLCEWQAMGLSQLTYYTTRSEKTLRPLLRKLVAQGKLQYRYPDNLTHPKQEYCSCKIVTE